MSKGLAAQAQRPLSVSESGSRDAVVLLPVPLVGGLCFQRGSFMPKVGVVVMEWWCLC